MIECYCQLTTRATLGKLKTKSILHIKDEIDDVKEVNDKTNGESPRKNIKIDSEEQTNNHFPVSTLVRIVGRISDGRKGPNSDWIISVDNMGEFYFNMLNLASLLFC